MNVWNIIFKQELWYTRYMAEILTIRRKTLSNQSIKNTGMLCGDIKKYKTTNNIDTYKYSQSWKTPIQSENFELMGLQCTPIIWYIICNTNKLIEK